jgi:hypothetical protein
MNCALCQAPKRWVWPPVTSLPSLNRIDQRGWFTLWECSVCHTLWVSAHYEPYGSFTYLVLWVHTRDQWLRIVDLEDGRIISAWCDSEIRRAWPHMDSSDVEAVERHRKRSYGRTLWTKRSLAQRPICLCF